MGRRVHTRIRGRRSGVSESSWELRAAPMLGEHNREVFCDGLGLSTEELVQLRANGVV